MCPGVILENRKINCLIFADDLLLSPIAEGLQKSINSLQNHALNWKLKINVNKTNAMVFFKNGHFLTNYKFTLQNSPIETVDKQTS